MIASIVNSDLTYWRTLRGRPILYKNTPCRSQQQASIVIYIL